MPIVTTVSQQIEDICGLSFTTCEHHTEDRDSRILRDKKDTQKLINWFESHDPFPVSDFVMSISTGLLVDEAINCHRAFENGNSSMISLVERKNFQDIKFERKSRVAPLRGFKSKVKIGNKDVPVNLETLFLRISLLKNSQTELQNYFPYKLAPYPLSIFNECGMRKSSKSMLYDLFTPITDINFESATFVIDGGFLLHRVLWKSGDSFSEILNKNMAYIKNH